MNDINDFAIELIHQALAADEIHIDKANFLIGFLAN